MGAGSQGCLTNTCRVPVDPGDSVVSYSSKPVQQANGQEVETKWDIQAS